MTERAMTELQMIKVPDLIQDYAQTYYEWGIRNGCFRVFSHRQKFDRMTNDEVGKELDRLKTEIIEQYGDAVLGVLRPHLGLGVTERDALEFAINSLETDIDDPETFDAWKGEASGYVGVLRAIAGRVEAKGKNDGA